ncbi:MAG: hypothetical protein FWC77_03590 [Defluviitaleaceae bacterium]|nr:hypothetical protein [Defluviitaleaceae bacterium]
MQSTANRKGISTHRSERICIDISDSMVSVIKLDPQGVMIRAGSAKAPALPGMPDDAYVTDLSAAIKKAAWAAKVSMGFGASCVVGVSMPDLTIQRFKWPDMPTEALLSVAATEMVPYLPGGKSNFHIGCEVLRQNPGELEVLAAAMPEEHAVAVDTACRWANFKPKRIDIRENARSRLVKHWCAPIEGAVPSTYAILDAGPGAANIAFYRDGLFHSNRYFAPEFVKLEEVEDFEMLMSVKAGGIGSNESAIRYDTHKLTEEITSAIDHFHRIMGEKISCILLMDDENIPGIEENLRGSQNMPVLKPSQWVTPGVKRPNLRRMNQDSFLDAFAVGMPSLMGHDCRMDLSIPNIAKPDENAAANMSRQAANLPGPSMDVPAPGINMALQAADPATEGLSPTDEVHMSNIGMMRQIPEAPMPQTNEFAPHSGYGWSTIEPEPERVPYTRASEPGRAPYTREPEPERAPYSRAPEPERAPYTREPEPGKDLYTRETVSPMMPYSLPPPERVSYYEGPEIPIPAGYVELPELPPELAALGLEHDTIHHDKGIIEDMAKKKRDKVPATKDESLSETHEVTPEIPKHHESPFDIVSSTEDDLGGFPYAIPEGPRPAPGTRMPLIAAAAVVVVMLIAAVLIPLRTTSALRAELNEIEENISNYASADTLFILDQQRFDTDRQINSLRVEIDNVNGRMHSVRDFYLRLPALILVPEVLEASGLIVDSVVVTESAHEHQVVVSGRTNNFRSILDGVEYLRLHSSYQYLMAISFSIAYTDEQEEVDAYGYVTYIITITVNPGWSPFWLNNHVVRSWP